MWKIEKTKFLSNDIRYIPKGDETLFILSDIIDVFESSSFSKQSIVSEYSKNLEIEINYGSLGKSTEKLVSTQEVLHLLDERWNFRVKHRLFQEWFASEFMTKNKGTLQYWLLKLLIRIYEFGDTGDTSLSRLNTKNWRLAVLFNFAVPIIFSLFIAYESAFTHKILRIYLALSATWFFLFLIQLERFFFLLVLVLAILAFLKLI